MDEAMEAVYESPYAVAFFKTSRSYELAIAVWAVVHFVAQILVIAACRESWVTEKLRRKGEKPISAAMLVSTYAIGFVHALVVSATSVAVTAWGMYDIWPAVLAYSIGYFIADFCFYAVPSKQAAICIHHLVMIFGHYPVAEPQAATLYGAGNPELIVFLSALGYLTEISNLFLDIRWYQLKVLSGVSHGLYTLNSVFLLATYIVTRIFIMPYGIIKYMLPRYEQYVAMHQQPAFYMITVGAAFITLLSVGYTYILLRGGMKAFLYFGGGKSAKAA